MAIWPFGKKNKNDAADAAPAHEQDAVATAASASTEDAPASAVPDDARDANMGPFDGDTVNIEEFDFGDFSVGILDLESFKMPLPKGSQVQVEMGEQGPRMLHIVTEYGRITPVAFAAPISSGQWAKSAQELREGMSRDGADAHLEQGPWGDEVTSSNGELSIRMIGAEGPRWMLRCTLLGPQEKKDELASLARDIMARTFVYRGDNPILAGESLPIVMPAALVEQVQMAMQQRQQNAQQQAAADAETDAERAAAEQMDDLRAQQGDAK